MSPGKPNSNKNIGVKTFHFLRREILKNFSYLTPPYYIAYFSSNFSYKKIFFEGF